VADDFKIKERQLDPAARAQFRFNRALQNDQILLPYENVLIEMLEQSKEDGITISGIDMWNAFLQKELSKKLDGFDPVTTSEYYFEFIAHRIESIWVRAEQVEENLSWYILSEKDDRLGTKLVEEKLADVHPDWLPSEIMLMDLIDKLSNSQYQQGEVRLGEKN
jgi:hypothetical protein